MAKSKTILKKVVSTKTNLELWQKLANVINVKFSEKSGWYPFKGVENNMFVLEQRNGETFHTNTILVKYYA